VVPRLIDAWINLYAEFDSTCIQHWSVLTRSVLSSAWTTGNVLMNAINAAMNPASLVLASV